MAIASSGQIAMSTINSELGRAWNHNSNLNDPALRNLAGRPTNGSYIAMSDFWGKSSYTPMTGSASGSYNSYNTQTAGGTATGSGTANISNGSGGYTYAWTLDSYTGLAPTLSSATSQTCYVTRTYTKGSAGNFTAYLTCVVTDSLGYTKSVSTSATCEWYNGQIQ